MSKMKTVLVILLLSFTAVSVIVFIARETKRQPDALPADKTPAPGVPAPGSCLQVYYFYGNVRCATCRKIEAYAKETVSLNFAEEVRTGRVRLSAINVDEEPNTHFTGDYQLVTRSVVLSDLKDGKEVRWKNLAQIWDKVDDKDAFIAYVTAEIRAYLGGEAK